MKRKAVFTESRLMLHSREPKAQAIGYLEHTVECILGADGNSEPSPEEWDLRRLGDKTRMLIYILEDLTPEQLAGLGDEKVKAFLQQQLRCAYDIKGDQFEQQDPWLMREADRYLIHSQIDTLRLEYLQAMDGLRGYSQKDSLIEFKNKAYEMLVEMMVQISSYVNHSIFIFQPLIESAPKAYQG